MSNKEILMQPNNLIKSKYDFTSIENKLFYKLLFNAQKQNEKSPLYTAEISLDEIKVFVKRTNDFVTSGIQDTLNLFKQSILEFEYIDENTGEKALFSSGLVVASTYIESSQIYRIEIHEILYKHITDFMMMQREGLGYTALNLSLLFKFRGAYSQRLYTFLRMWSRQNKEVEVKYSIDDLRNYLKIRPDTYPAYKNFKQKVIKKSLEEINKLGNMKVEIKDEIKKGRKVDQIVFSVIDHEPRKYFDKQDIVKAIDYAENENNDEIEQFIDEKCINTQEKEKETLKIENKEFYVPDETVFTKGTLRSFKMDFANIDFKDTYMKRAFDDAVMIVFDRDDVETIKATSYKFFKGTLDNKIVEYEKEKEEDIKYKEEMDMFW